MLGSGLGMCRLSRWLRIFNRIAGVDELQGIRRHPDGRPLMDRGRKVLEDTALDSGGRTRSKGKREFAHEAQLVLEGSANFEAINSLVRGA